MSRECARRGNGAKRMKGVERLFLWFFDLFRRSLVLESAASARCFPFLWSKSSGSFCSGGGFCLAVEVQGLARGTTDHGMYENHALEPLDRGPYFDVTASHNVTALVGKTATLNCRVRNLGDRTVSWVRHRDIHLLTTGVETYTSDQRFVATHFPQTEDWTLQVKYPQRRDTGTYECQVSTTPPIGHSMHLSVVEPVTSIVGEPEMFINRGSTMNLTCVVHHSPEPPTAIFWTHDREVINYDSPRGGVSVITEKGEVTTSYLLVQRAQPADSGHYTCHPSNANTKTVLVHVLNGEHPAAMQHGGQLRLANLPFVMISTTLLAFLNHRY